MNSPSILLLRTGGLGDGLLLWPGLSDLRRRHPEAHLAVMGHPERLALLCGPGGADEALDVEGSGLHLFYEIEPDLNERVRAVFGAWDVVVVFAALEDHALAENLLACGVKEVHVFLPEPTEGEGLHVAAHVKRALLDAGLGAPGPLPLLPLPDEDRAAAGRLLAQAGLPARGLVLLAPGSGSEKKNWPADHFAGLCDALHEQGFSPVLLQGPADQAAVQAVYRELKEQALAAPPLLADIPPGALRGLCARAELFVGNDSGPTHLSALLGTPTLAIFSASDPGRWHPLGPRAAWAGGMNQPWPKVAEILAHLPPLLDDDAG